jgi:hypothetical protein
MLNFQMHGAVQAWERNSFSAKWCRDMRLDVRGMNFAREVRRQLTDLVRKADFLPDKELAGQGKGGKRKRDSDGVFPSPQIPEISASFLTSAACNQKVAIGTPLEKHLLL